MGTGESVKQRIQYSKCEIGWTRVKIDNVERDRWRVIMKERESDRREKKNRETEATQMSAHTTGIEQLNYTLWKGKRRIYLSEKHFALNWLQI